MAVTVVLLAATLVAIAYPVRAVRRQVTAGAA